MNDETLVYEIVEQADGDIALVRTDGQGESLVSIKFSDESLVYLQGAKLDVAKVMIEAGLDAVAEINQGLFEDETEDADNAVLH